MQTLEILYDNPPKSRSFLPRKKTIESKKALLCGPRFSGKSAIIIEHLSNYKQEEYLYIDFRDIRVDPNNIKDTLRSFIKEKNIKLLVLEHFDHQCAIPNTEEIILSSTKPIHLEGFTTNMIFPLDFEEFISFEKKNANIEQIFNLYANVGTYPSIVLGREEEKYRNLQNMLTSSNHNCIEILKALSQYSSSKTSILKIYETLKQKSKLSKDTLYNHIQTLQDESLIYMVERYNQPRVAKKLYFIDFALHNALTFKKDFLKRFENIVFSELIKKEQHFFYTIHTDFYIPTQEVAIICTPFLPPELIKRRFMKIKTELINLGVKNLYAITVGNEGVFRDSGIKCEALPFWQWAMR